MGGGVEGGEGGSGMDKVEAERGMREGRRAWAWDLGPVRAEEEAARGGGIGEGGKGRMDGLRERGDARCGRGR